MTVTLDLDDELVQEAQRLTGLTDISALLHEGLRALIEREKRRP
jgi:Arc/MetJ family transcription regulator